MDPARAVCCPYVVMLFNLPVKEEVEERTGQKKYVCQYSNENLALHFGDFSGHLTKTVKIAYLKHGAVCVNGAACAYAEFKEFHQALAVSDVFLNNHRGRDAYIRKYGQRTKALTVDKAEVYGWLATRSDFKFLEKRCLKRFNVTMTTFGEIMEEKRRQQVHAEQLHAQKKEELEELNRKCEAQNQSMEAELRKLEGAKKNDAAAQARLQKTRHARRQELARLQVQYARQMQEAENESAEMESRLFEKAVADEERKRVARRVQKAQDEYHSCKIKKEEFERQCRLEDGELEEYAQKLRDGKAGWEALRQKLMQTFKISEANREILRVHKGLDFMTAEGCALWDTTCSICTFAFTKVMSFDEQTSKGITAEQLQEINMQPPSDERCWRNKLLPCGHAKFCGSCCEDMKKNAMEKQKDWLCPFCYRVVESSVLFRVTEKASVK